MRLAMTDISLTFCIISLSTHETRLMQTNWRSLLVQILDDEKQIEMMK